MRELAGWMAAWITDVIDSLGYLGVAFLIFAENIVPPIPSELVLPFAGFLVSEGRFSFVALLLVATAGSVASSIVWWTVGWLYGERRVYRVVERFGRWILLRPSDVKKAQAFFDSHGAKAVFFGRFVPGVRSLVSIPAGLAQMSLPSFVLFTTLGSGLWNALLIGVGVILRDRWRDVLDYLDAFETVVYAGIAATIVLFVLFRVRGLLSGRESA